MKTIKKSRFLSVLLFCLSVQSDVHLVVIPSSIFFQYLCLVCHFRNLSIVLYLSITCVILCFVRTLPFMSVPLSFFVCLSDLPFSSIVMYVLSFCLSLLIFFLYFFLSTFVLLGQCTNRCLVSLWTFPVNNSWIRLVSFLSFF